MSNIQKAPSTSRLSGVLITGEDAKRTFDVNWLNIFDRSHPDLPDSYKIDFIHKAQLSGADPRKNQIHLTSYYSKKLGHKVGVSVFSYHFFIDRANQTKELGNMEVNAKVEKVFNPVTKKEVDELVATATVERKGRGKTSFKARWSECYNSKNSIWNDRPYQMLEKTAIANVLRWAFPETLSGMYIEEEIREDNYILAEKVEEDRKAIESTAKKIEHEAEVLEDAKQGGRSKKIPLIESITTFSTRIANGFTIEQKVKWMQETLGIDSFKRLDGMKIKELEELLSVVEKIANEPVVMPDSFTANDIPWEDENGTN